MSGVLRCRVRPTESESRHAPQGDSQSGRHRQNLAANHGASGTFALCLRHRRNNPLKVWLCSGLIPGPIVSIVRLTPSLCAPTQQANPPTFRTRRWRYLTVTIGWTRMCEHMPHKRRVRAKRVYRPSKWSPTGAETRLMWVKTRGSAATARGVTATRVQLCAAPPATTVVVPETTPEAKFRTDTGAELQTPAVHARAVAATARAAKVRTARG